MERGGIGVGVEKGIVMEVEEGTDVGVEEDMELGVEKEVEVWVEEGVGLRKQGERKEESKDEVGIGSVACMH